MHRSKPILFGVFEVDFAKQELLRKGVQVKLQRQPFQILLLLIERPGEFVTRKEIREALWPDDHFGNFDQSINTAILRLRRHSTTLPERRSISSPLPEKDTASSRQSRQRNSYRVVSSIRAIAVLPFQDFSKAEDTKYFVQGFTDSLVTEMVLLSDLRVVPRITMERCIDAQEDSRRIAHELTFKRWWRDPFCALEIE